MRSRWPLALALVLGLAGCDQATKHLAETHLRAAPVSLVPGVFDLDYAENRDVGFHLLRSIASDELRWTVIVSVAMAALAILAISIARARDRVTTLALGAIAAGAIGNLIDRFARGHVVDFLHLHHWRVFNVADVCIAVGAALLAASALRARDAPG